VALMILDFPKDLPKPSIKPDLTCPIRTQKDRIRGGCRPGGADCTRQEAMGETATWAGKSRKLAGKGSRRLNCEDQRGA
jgi:hypothetical protein